MVVLALDGINDSVARSAWSQARVETLTSTSPTTSVTGWLTAATGLSPAEHGVLGVVYWLPEAGTCFHVFLDEALGPGGELPPARMTDAPTFFERARADGVRCLANPGELASWPSAWTDTVLRGAELVPSPTDWTALRHDPLGAADAAIRETEAALGPAPRLVWTFVNFDDYLHRRGYDAPHFDALARLEQAAAEWAAAGHAVVAHPGPRLVESVSDDEARRARAEGAGPGTRPRLTRGPGAGA